MTQESDKALEILSVALEMEKKGKSFYEKAVSECKNSLGKNIFTILKNDEIIHVKRIKTIYNEIEKSGNWSDAWKSHNPDHNQLSAMFRDIAARNGPDVQADAKDIEALDIGIKFEAAAVKFYEARLVMATDSIEKEFIKKMILEEKDHHRALTDMHLYLSNPASWFDEKQHSGLDGA